MSVVDIVIVLIVIISVIVGFKRGFVKTLVGLVSLILAFVIAYAVAPPISEKLYDNVLESKLSAMLGFDLGGGEAETAASDTASSEASRMLFLGGTNLFNAPRLASAIDVSKLKNIEGMISNLKPDLVAKMDPDEMQRLVNFLCSSACANKTISSCVSAYNKKYGTSIDVTPILKAANVSGSTKIPAALSMLGMNIDVKDPILNVQKRMQRQQLPPQPKQLPSPRRRQPLQKHLLPRPRPLLPQVRRARLQRPPILRRHPRRPHQRSPLQPRRKLPLRPMWSPILSTAIQMISSRPQDKPRAPSR